MNHRAVILALASAALFGLSTPASKSLLGAVDPTVLAGLLYLGAGLGVGILRRLRPAGGAREAALARKDVPWLGGAIVAGGVFGPILLLAGLSRTDAAMASLLLTLEGVATALLAWFAFHESFDRRIALGMALLIAGAVALSWSGTPTWGNLLGPLAIMAACIAWGLDNNLTRNVSLSDPLQIVELKGLVAGPVNLLLALAAGNKLPSLGIAVVASIVGFLGYGVSLVLYVKALRDLGTARTGAYFSTAPFLGAVAALAALGEPITLQLLVAGVLMGLGVWLHLTETHEHEHEHLAMEHAHAHTHEAHHQHEHGPSDPPGEPHAHRHAHGAIRHRPRSYARHAPHAPALRFAGRDIDRYQMPAWY